MLVLIVVQLCLVTFAKVAIVWTVVGCGWGLLRTVTRQAPKKPKVAFNEPPRIDSAIPLIGHMIGLVQSGPWYYQKLFVRFRYAVWTLPILGSKTYVIASIEAIRAVDKQSRTIRQNGFSAKVGQWVFLFSQRLVDRMTPCIESPDAHGSTMFANVGEDAEKLLAPGPDLARLVGRSQAQLADQFQSLKAEAHNPVRIHLYHWIQRVTIKAAIAAVFGADYPLVNDPSLLEDLLLFEDNALRFTALPVPALTMRKTFKARSRLITAIASHISKDQEGSTLSPFIQAYHKLRVAQGATAEEMSSFHLATIFGVISNIPLAFWLIAEIFARSKLLEDIRAEIEACTPTPNLGSSILDVEPEQLRRRCPVLKSTLQEVYRHKSLQLIFRHVLEDTVVDLPAERTSYIFKKGALVHMPASISHLDPEIWGDDAADFDAYRFTRAEGSYGTAAGRTRQRHAMRHFGGGAALCPGRHLADAMLLMIAAQVVTMFDIESVDGGLLEVPSPAKRLQLSTVKPVQDVEVLVRARSRCDAIEGFID